MGRFAIIVFGFVAVLHGAALAVDFRGYAQAMTSLMNGMDQPAKRYDLGSGQYRVKKSGPYTARRGMPFLGGIFVVAGFVFVMVGIFAHGRAGHP